MILKKGGTPAGPKRGRSAIQFPLSHNGLQVNTILVKKPLYMLNSISIRGLSNSGFIILEYFGSFGNADLAWCLELE
jgi:hypothetical protein